NLGLRTDDALGQMVGRAPSNRANDEEPVHRLPHAAEFELSLDLRRYPDAGARRPNRDRRRLGDALPAKRDRRVRFDRAYSSRRELRMDDPKLPLCRRLDVLPGSLHPYLPGALLRVI